MKNENILNLKTKPGDDVSSFDRVTDDVTLAKIYLNIESTDSSLKGLKEEKYIVRFWVCYNLAESVN